MNKNVPDIKICGLTCVEDVQIVNQFPIAYAGFVLFYPKSKRNVSLEQAQQLKEQLKPSIQSVAVTVSPTLEQAKQIQEAGFHAIQIHGHFDKKVEKYLSIPIFRAINVTDEKDVRNAFSESSKKIAYFVFDGKRAGSGEVFDWDFLKENVDNTAKIMLAGGLHWKNVREAIEKVKPGIVDVSSGVEHDSGRGKDYNKVRQFIHAVIGMEN